MHMMMMDSSILKAWMLPLEFCCNVVCVHVEILLFSIREAPSWIFYFRSHLTIQKIAPLNSWTCKIWVEPLKLCSYIAYNLRYWFFKVLIETCICGRHLRFLSDNIDATIVPFCSPILSTKSRESHQSILVIVPCGSDMVAKRSALV